MEGINEITTPNMSKRLIVKKTIAVLPALSLKDKYRSVATGKTVADATKRASYRILQWDAQTNKSRLSTAVAVDLGWKEVEGQPP